MSYVDGFVVPVPKDKIDAYRRCRSSAARSGASIGALSFRECIADDVKPGQWTRFRRA